MRGALLTRPMFQYQPPRRSSYRLRPGCLSLAQAREVLIGERRAVSGCFGVNGLYLLQAVLVLGEQGVHVKKLPFSLMNQTGNQSQLNLHLLLPSIDTSGRAEHNRYHGRPVGSVLETWALRPPVSFTITYFYLLLPTFSLPTASYQ